MCFLFYVDLFVVHTVISKIFFRCKVCLQTYTFIYTNDQVTFPGGSRLS